MEVYAVNPNNEFISAADLKTRIQNVMDDDRLNRLGFDIIVSFFQLSTVVLYNQMHTNITQIKERYLPLTTYSVVG